MMKVASGGELSRFLLALKVALADRGSAPTLVFDEIDTGVGGAVADAIGQRLRRLAGQVQVSRSPMRRRLPHGRRRISSSPRLPPGMTAWRHRSGQWKRATGRKKSPACWPVPASPTKRAPQRAIAAGKRRRRTLAHRVPERAVLMVFQASLTGSLIHALFHRRIIVSTQRDDDTMNALNSLEYRKAFNDYLRRGTPIRLSLKAEDLGHPDDTLYLAHARRSAGPPFSH